MESRKSHRAASRPEYRQLRFGANAVLLVCCKMNPSDWMRPPYIRLGRYETDMEENSWMKLQAAQNTERVGDAGILWDFWYPAARSSGDAGAEDLTKAMLHRSAAGVGTDGWGAAFAMRDACPHRGIPLSYGRFDGKNVECSYHGWKFDGCSGQCEEIPSLTSQDKLKVERIFAGHYPCQEYDGYVWVYMREAPSRSGDTVPAAPSYDIQRSDTKAPHLACDLPSHVDQGIIGLMDPAHGPFVHQSWFWRSKKSIHEKAKQFEPIPFGFRMSTHSPSTNSAPYQLLQKMTGAPVTTTIDFILPNTCAARKKFCSGKLWFPA